MWSNRTLCGLSMGSVQLVICQQESEFGILSQFVYSIERKANIREVWGWEGCLVFWGQEWFDSRCPSPPPMSPLRDRGPPRGDAPQCASLTPLRITIGVRVMSGSMQGLGLELEWVRVRYWAWVKMMKTRVWVWVTDKLVEVFVVAHTQSDRKRRLRTRQLKYVPNYYATLGLGWKIMMEFRELVGVGSDCIRYGRLREKSVA